MADSHRLFKTGFDNNGKLIQLNDEQLDRLKACMLDILKDFIKVADEYQLTYTLSGGSVIGAVRHHGFIPWDDDIDINMPRADYNKLLQVFPEKMGDKYVLCSPEYTHDHGMLCAQIKKKGTVYRSYNELSKSRENCGILIDIFIVENTFNNSLIRKLHGYACLAMGYLSTCRKTYADLPYLKNYLAEGSEAERAFKKKAKIGHLFSRISLDRVTRMACRCYSLCKNNQSEYVTIPSGRGHYFKEIQRRDTLCETVDVLFEGVKVKNPKGFDTYLRSLYGDDYMQLPPVEKRESHPMMELDFGD